MFSKSLAATIAIAGAVTALGACGGDSGDPERLRAAALAAAGKLRAERALTGELWSVA